MTQATHFFILSTLSKAIRPCITGVAVFDVEGHCDKGSSRDKSRNQSREWGLHLPCSLKWWMGRELKFSYRTERVRH